MRCPRCRREVPDATAFCIGCGTPLSLAEEPPPRPLDASIAIDRREGERTVAVDTVPGLVPAAVTRTPRRGELADLERSHWDVGRAPIPERGPPPGPVPAPPGRDSAEPAVGAIPAMGTRPPAAAAGPVRDTLRPPGAERAPDPEPRGRGEAEPGAAAEADAGGTFLQADHDLPVTAQRVVRVVRPSTWRRAGAWTVDAVPFAAGAIALARAFLREATGGLAPAAGLDGALDFLARERVIVTSVVAAAALALAVYATLAHALAGATLGKRLFHLRLVGPDGRRPTMARSAARSALGVVSAALLGLGFLLALFTRSGRALHDFVSRTWVVEAP